MPLMVDPSGYPIYAGQPQAETFVAPTTVLPADISVFGTSTASPTATSTYTNAALTVTAAAVEATSDARTQAEIIRDQQAIQAGLDNQTPRNLMLAFMGLLLLVMLLSHPRFLARLMASFKRSQTKQKTYSFDTPPHSATPLQDHEQKPAGGGDLKRGWVLRAGNKRFSTDDNRSAKSDPFASPFDEVEFSSNLSAPAYSPPPHIVPLLHHLPFSSTLLYAPFAKLPRAIASSVSLSELYIILGYLVLNAFALIWRSDVTPTTKEKGYGYDFYRTGLVALTQFPIAVALGVRGNLIGLCIGKGYEKLKRLHKIVGRVLFLAATLHTMFYLHKFAVAGTTSKMLSKPFLLAGLLSWVAIMLVAATSIPQVRNAWYGIFKVCHVAGMLMLLIGMCYHVDVAVPWCVASMAIYGFSIICGLFKARMAHAEIVALSDSQTTVITIPGLRDGWRAGQHVRIRIPALGMTYGLQAHPFTIASAPNGEGMVLMCKVVGTWTRHLFDFAVDASCAQGEKGQHQVVQATVVIEGPYGGLGNTMLPSFSGLVLVAGGSGITHALSLAHDLVNRAPSGVVRARVIDLVWTVRTEDMARPLIPTLLDLVDDARAFEEKCLEGRKLQQDLPSPLGLRIHIHVTRCPASSPITLLSPSTPIDNPNPFASEHDDILEDRKGLRRQPSAAEREKAEYLNRTRVQTLSVSSRTSSKGRGYYSPVSSISVSKRRPDFTGMLDEMADEVRDRARRERTDPSGICVTVCGPLEMCNAVRDTVRRLPGKRRRLVGGVELEQETFGF